MKKMKYLPLAAVAVAAPVLALALSAAAAAETVNFVCDAVKTITFKGEKRQFREKLTYAVETQKKKVTDGYGYVYDLKEFSSKALSFVTPPDKTKWFTAFAIDRETGAFSVTAHDSMGKKAVGAVAYGGTCKPAQ